MPILPLTDTPVVPGDHQFRTQEELKTSTVFDKELSIEKIKYQVDGMRWTVDYFNQILNVNTAPLAPDINVPETTLKYNRIDNLDIYVGSGLPDGGVTDIVGNGIINAGFVPYFGDAFTATLAGGRIGIFVITAVNKEYYNTHDIYAIDFKLTYFLDTSADIHNDLVYKTVRTYVYDKNAIDTFSVPVILASDYVKRLDMAKQPSKIITHYLDTFYDKDSKLLRLPTQASVYADQLVTTAFFSMVSVSEAPELANVTRVNSDINAVTVWDAILKRDINLLNICSINLHYSINTVGLRSSKKVTSYLGINYYITADVSKASISPPVIVNPLIDRKVVESPITNRDTNYIFSNDFYAQTSGVAFSKFETALIAYINGTPPNRGTVEQLLTEYVFWAYEDQYTLLPILLLLVKSLVNNTYSAI